MTKLADRIRKLTGKPLPGSLTEAIQQKEFRDETMRILEESPRARRRRLAQELDDAPKWQRAELWRKPRNERDDGD